MPSSHRRHGQDKTVLSCPCLWCEVELNRRQVKTVFSSPRYTQWSKKPLPNIIRLCSSITVRVNTTIFCCNVRTTNVIQQVTVCAPNVHQELWHKHEDEYATVWLRYRWCADRVHPTRRRYMYVLAAHWCPSRGVCKPSPASRARFCSLPD